MTEAETHSEAIDSLQAIPLFARVAARDREAIAARLIERRFPKHATIVEEGLPGDYMYIIREGRVKVTLSSEDGREKIMDFLTAGDFFGEMSLLDRAPRSASVETVEPVRLLALSRGDFLDLLRNSSELALSVIQVLVSRLREADDQASSLSFEGVKERVVRLLRRIAVDEGDGARLTPKLTHQDIANMIGTSRETVTRIVKQLKTEGWLGQRGKRYVILADE